MQLLDIELHIHPLVAENVVKILDAAVATKAMPSRQKLLFSQRKIEFMEDFGPDISCIQKAKDDHEKLTEDVKKEAKDTEVKSEKAIETIEGTRFRSFSKSSLQHGIFQKHLSSFEYTFTFRSQWKIESEEWWG